jgi:hypothetical protein
MNFYRMGSLIVLSHECINMGWIGSRFHRVMSTHFSKTAKNLRIKPTSCPKQQKMSTLTPPTDPFHSIFLNKTFRISYWHIVEQFKHSEVVWGGIWKNHIFSTGPFNGGQQTVLIGRTRGADLQPPQLIQGSPAPCSDCSSCTQSLWPISHARGVSALPPSSSSHPPSPGAAPVGWIIGGVGG